MKYLEEMQIVLYGWKLKEFKIKIREFKLEKQEEVKSGGIYKV